MFEGMFGIAHLVAGMMFLAPVILVVWAVKKLAKRSTSKG